MALMRSASFVAGSAAEAADLAARLLIDGGPHPGARAVVERCFSNLWNAGEPVAEVLRREVSG
jgi:hypothetical protein